MPECMHLDQITPVAASSNEGSCQECLKSGDSWVHLRRCLSCGHIGCCDSSPKRHASRHYTATGHPVVVSHQPAEFWGWCFPDGLFLEFEEGTSP
ncbi:UBP-type zinc finger domain-containing protein [Streptomyces sp. NPDC048665]|uniref:UBP-type zinc finger domain-containing protein n=1 Tax=Streptomyces sp. NPDC048665 TaxID=3155490 RepID=UPI003422B129